MQIVGGGGGCTPENFFFFSGFGGLFLSKCFWEKWDGSFKKHTKNPKIKKNSLGPCPPPPQLSALFNMTTSYLMAMSLHTVLFLKVGIMHSLIRSFGLGYDIP